MTSLHFPSQHIGSLTSVVSELNIICVNREVSNVVSTGNLTHPNLFSRDIFDLLYSKTGAHPFVRVGGTST